MIAVCVIPGCKRSTSKVDGAEFQWICGKHWGRLTKAERRVFARIRRIARRYGWEVVDARGSRIWTALIRRASS